jgi:lactose/L-arabinose transport system substrate-binding protein
MSSKMIYKFLAVVLLSVMVLSACAPATSAPATAAPATAAPATAAPATAAPATAAPATAAPATAAPATAAPASLSGKLTVWCWKAAWTDSIVKSGSLDTFKAQYPNVEIEYVETSPSDIYQKLPLAISAGTGAPDFACVESSHLAQMVALGGLTDLTEQVAPYVDKMNAYKWSDAMLDGKYYAMPWDSGPVVMYYRRDVFKAAGLASDPESVSALVATWDDYLNVCKTIKEKTGDDCFANNKANNYARLYEMMLWQQGFGYTDASGKVTVDSPENVATLEELKKFWDAGLLSDQLEWTDGWYAELAAGGTAPVATVGPGTPEPAAVKPVASLVEAAWMGVFLKSWIAVGTEGLWGVASMPAMKAGQVRTSNDGGSNVVIPDQSQNKAAAWALAEWLFGKTENQVAIFKANDIFPSLESAYSDPVFSEPDPFFGDQKVRTTYVEAVKVIPVGYVYGPNYALMNKYVSTAIQKVATGAASVKDALTEAANAIRNDTGLP